MQKRIWKANMKSEIAVLVMAVLLAIVFFAPIEDTQKAVDKEGEVEERREETAYAPWFNEGDPWFAEGDELNRLSGEELRALARRNETVRKMLEEDQKLEPVQIESLEDLGHLPENYPEELKRQMIEDYLARQSLPEEAEAGFENYQESTTGEVNESTTDKNEST